MPALILLVLSFATILGGTLTVTLTMVWRGWPTPLLTWQRYWPKEISNSLAESRLQTLVRSGTVRLTHSRTIVILWYEIMVLWPKKIALKFMPRLCFWLLININWIFNWSTFGQIWSRGFKTVGAQSLRPPVFKPGLLEEQQFTIQTREKRSLEPKRTRNFLTTNFDDP